jgi:hypothetical protein
VEKRRDDDFWGRGEGNCAGACVIIDTSIRLGSIG